MLKEILTRFSIFCLTVISMLPFWVLYVFSDILFFILFYVLKYRKAVVDENLRNSFPDKSLEERNIIAKKYFMYLADLIVETIKMISISAEEGQKRFHILNPELLEYYVGKGRNVCVVAGHYGNWEMANVVGFCTDKKKLVIYKPLTNRIFDEFLNNVRSKFSVLMIPMKGIMRKMVELRNEASISFYLSDQTPVRHEANYFTNFLNQNTAVFLGVEKIAKTTNSVVVFCKVKPIRRGYYTCEFIPLIEEPLLAKEFEITQKHVRYLENIINEVPQYWIWSHKRWKF
jgi:KDO2-lipid IV(A) lauroyltransferase